jgi:hypothetical protein
LIGLAVSGLGPEVHRGSVGINIFGCVLCSFSAVLIVTCDNFKYIFTIIDSPVVMNALMGLSLTAKHGT